MLIVHREKRPRVHATAWVAPNATVCGDVTIGAHSRVLFGAVLVAQGGSVEIGRHCIVMENAVVRGTARHPLRVGDHVLIGPRASLSGCTVEENAFLATWIAPAPLLPLCNACPSASVGRSAIHVPSAPSDVPSRLSSTPRGPHTAS